MNRKTVIVTGSSRGIGKAIAIKYAKKNYNVVINASKSEDELNQTKKEIESFQSPCLSFLGDMGEYKNAVSLYDQVKKQFGGADLLINNAGISYIGLFSDMKPEEWDRIIRTNLTSVYNMTSLAVPHMVSNHYGKIVNISSVWGCVGASCEVAYSATKGAVNALTKALARELAPSNIQVNAVACGAIDTQMNHFLTDEELIALTDEIPSGRLGTCEEVADFVYQLTHKNSYLTGQVINLDGGWK